MVFRRSTALVAVGLAAVLLFHIGQRCMGAQSAALKHVDHSLSAREYRCTSCRCDTRSPYHRDFNDQSLDQHTRCYVTLRCRMHDAAGHTGACSGGLFHDLQASSTSDPWTAIGRTSCRRGPPTAPSCGWQPPWIVCAMHSCRRRYA